MTLKALIIGAEGALVDIDELQRQAFQRLIAEAGYDWPCERSDFARLADLARREERLERLVTDRLRPAVSLDVVAPLVAAMKKRLASLMDELLSEGGIALRPGIRDLVIAARADGLGVALVSHVDPRELDRILGGATGIGRGSFDCIVEDAHDPQGLVQARMRALSQLGVAVDSALAVEGTNAGAAGASAAGLRVIVTRGAYCRSEAIDETSFVVGSLLGLLSTPPPHGPDHLGAEGRAELVSALHRLHAGIIDLDGVSQRSSDMKVSEILKSKGSVVKSISSGETIWALAHRLKSDAIGALVVMRADGTIEGIISERDIARGLAEHASALPAKTVADLMTKTVITCTPDDSVAAISRVMTERRIRHLPVVEGGKVVGLISIGDVLRHRLDQMQREVNVLRDYAIAKS